MACCSSFRNKLTCWSDASSFLAVSLLLLLFAGVTQVVAWIPLSSLVVPAFPSAHVPIVHPARLVRHFLVSTDNTTVDKVQIRKKT